MKMIFDGSQKVIGKGAQAEVLLYKGFAYKVYKESYPAEWIAFEKEQQKAVNKADAISTTIPLLSETAGLMLSDEEKSQVLPAIEHLSLKYKNCICHLDMHFLNIMIPDDAELIADKIDYTIIDWMNARLAPPVFDYARTYVIFNEFAKEVLDIYKTAVWPDLLSLDISEEDFFEAVKVCTILRSHEK